MPVAQDQPNPDVDAWQSLGRRVPTSSGNVFVVDVPAPVGAQDQVPVVVLHGFPTSSFDWRHVLDALGRGRRRVVLFDFLGFGLSDKPDIRYGIDLHADTAATVLDHAGIDRCVLVSHDMGDTVAGELLARTLPVGSIAADPAWEDDAVVTSGTGAPPAPLALEVTGRVVVNGSIYLDLAHLTPGQQRLWGSEDMRLPEELGALVGGDALADGLASVFHPHHRPDAGDRAAMVAMIEHSQGHLLLPRLIRYLDDRRRAEGRYTGAIEMHPSPCEILWAQADPVAVAEMGDRLGDRIRNGSLQRLGGFGHYPMIEDPARFGALLDGALRRLDDLPADT